MKKFISHISFFLFGFLLVFITIGKFDNIGRCQNKNENIQKLICMKNFDSLDILFLGNSYCYSGINPLYFDSVGIKTFNLGIATAGINFYSLLANDYLITIKKKPKSIFILVSPMVFSGKADNAVNNPIYRYLNSPISVEKYIVSYAPDLIGSYPKITAKNISRTCVNLYSYITSKKNYCEKENNPMFLSKGFITSSKKNSFKNELETNALFLPLLKNQFDTLKTQQILNMANELQRKNIKVVFYELPSNKLYSFFNSGFLLDYSKCITKLKANYTFISIDNKLSENYYRDQDHLNTEGATIVSKEIIKHITNQKELHDLYLTPSL